MGVSGAYFQHIRKRKLNLVSGILVIVFIPFVIQSANYYYHLFLHTPNLEENTIVSILLTSVGTLFDWYAMTRGAFVAEEDIQPFSADLLALIPLIRDFILGPIRWLPEQWKRLGKQHGS